MGDPGGNAGATVLSWEDLSDGPGQERYASEMGMASLEEGNSSSCQQILGKWEGYQLALTILYFIYTDSLEHRGEEDAEISGTESLID